MKRIAIAATFFLIASTAYAQEDVIAESDSLVRNAEWRIGAAAAFTDYESDSGSSAFSVDDSAVGVQFYAQYKFNRWFGLEGGYMDTGEFEDRTGESNEFNTGIRFTGFSLSALGYIPLGGASDNFDLYGKIGYFDLDVDLTSEPTLPDIPIQSVSTGHDTGLLLGAGTVIKMSESFGIRAEFDWYDVEESDHLWVLALGLEYHF